MENFNNIIFNKIVKRASNFVELDNSIEQEMLKMAIISTNIDIEKLCVFNEHCFKHDIIGLIKNFDFNAMKCNDFRPLSSRD